MLKQETRNTPETLSAAGRPFWTRRKREQLAGWLFMTPEIIGMLLVSLFPLLFSLVLSFTDWDLVGDLSSVKFVGFDNYIALFNDSRFLLAMKNNLIFTAVTVPVALVLGLLMAVAVQSKVYGKSYFKVAFFIPYICSTVAIAAVWSALYHPSKGPLNQFLLSIGVDNPPKWLVDTSFSLLAIMIIYIWQLIGYKLIIFMAGLSAIPDELYESATIDGANGPQQFRHITLPLLGPTTFFLAITSVISSFKVFDIIKFLTGGGPNYSSTVIVYQIYEEGFQRFRMGYASAMSWILFIIIVLVTSITWSTQNKKVHY